MIFYIYRENERNFKWKVIATTSNTLNSLLIETEPYGKEIIFCRGILCLYTLGEESYTR